MKSVTAVRAHEGTVFSAIDCGAYSVKVSWIGAYAEKDVRHFQIRRQGRSVEACLLDHDVPKEFTNAAQARLIVTGDDITGREGAANHSAAITQINHPLSFDAQSRMPPLVAAWYDAALVDDGDNILVNREFSERCKETPNSLILDCGHTRIRACVIEWSGNPEHPPKVRQGATFEDIHFSGEDILQRISLMVRERFNLKRNPNLIDIWDKGTVQIFGERIDITDLRDEAIQSACENEITHLDTFLKECPERVNVITVGGMAALFKTLLAGRGLRSLSFAQHDKIHSIANGALKAFLVSEAYQEGDNG